MPSYTINEPHPTVKQNTYTHSGRGGAGNTFLVSEQTTSPEGIPTKVNSCSIKSSSSRFFSGRGGAGNAHASQRQVAMSFDDEYYAEAARASAERVYVGRGGAGNYSKKNHDSHSAKSRRDSSSTTSSEGGGLWGRLSSSLRH